MRIRSAFAMVLSASVVFGQTPTIRSTVPLVVLPVSVSDRHGRFLDGLQASDFVVLDDGKPRDIRVYVADLGLAPVALVTLVQTTGLSRSALLKIRKIGAMIPEAVVGANGEGAVLTYDDDIRVLQDFTTEAAPMADAFHNLKPADTRGGRMLDAVEKALQMIAARPGPRRANILIVGETRDRGSKTKLSKLLADVQRTGATIYTLNYSAYVTPFTVKGSEYVPPDGGLLDAITEPARLAKRNASAALADASGGRQLRFETKGKLEDDLLRLGSEIHSRYLITFTPDPAGKPGFHHLEVQVKDRPDAGVRARPGYWATP